MRYRFIPAALVLLACLAGCGSDREQTLPDEVLGVWTSSVKGYEDKTLELRKDAILFGAGGSEYNADGIYKVEQSREPDGRTLIKVYFSDQDGNDYDTSLYYDPKDGGSLRFKNRTDVEWKLADRGPNIKVQGPAGKPARPLGPSTWSLLVALVGVALTSGATLWRRRHVPPPRERRERAALPEKPALEPGATLVPSIVEQRRSERILLMIPVEVEGIDVNGVSFTERTRTFSINRNGAFISLKNVPQQGDDISVTNLGNRQTCVFRLCESGKDPSGAITAWGIECLEPEVNFWQIRFPEKPPEPLPERRTIAVLIVCGACRTREVADLTVPQYHEMLAKEWMTRDCPDCARPTEWKFILVESAETGPGESPSLPSGEENRRSKRIVAKLPILLRHPEDGQVEEAVTENISRTGVCCAAAMELNAEQVILLTFEPGSDNQEEIPARIMWRRPMGEGRKTLYGIRLERKSP